MAFLSWGKERPEGGAVNQGKGREVAQLEPTRWLALLSCITAWTLKPLEACFRQ